MRCGAKAKNNTDGVGAEKPGAKGGSGNVKPYRQKQLPAWMREDQNTNVISWQVLRSCDPSSRRALSRTARLYVLQKRGAEARARTKAATGMDARGMDGPSSIQQLARTNFPRRYCDRAIRAREGRFRAPHGSTRCKNGAQRRAKGPKQLLALLRAASTDLARFSSSLVRTFRGGIAIARSELEKGAKGACAVFCLLSR